MTMQYSYNQSYSKVYVVIIELVDSIIELADSNIESVDSISRDGPNMPYTCM